MPFSDDPVRDWDQHNLECDRYDPREHDHCKCSQAGCPWCDPDGYGKEQGRILESALGDDVKEPLEKDEESELIVRRDWHFKNEYLPRGRVYRVIFPEPITVTEEDITIVSFDLPAEDETDE